VLYNGSVIYSSTSPIGGEKFDEAVQKYILEQGELKISLLDSRAIKEGIGAVWEGRNSQPVTISGTLALTGNKIKMTINTEDILGVFEEPLHELLTVIANAVKKIPIDYVEEVFANGIVLTGGGAMLFGLDKMISKVFNIDVAVGKNPADCVARGLSLVNTLIPIKNRSAGKNITSQLAKYYKANKNS
jgi:rod shape-determining protein MreB